MSLHGARGSAYCIEYPSMVALLDPLTRSYGRMTHFSTVRNLHVPIWGQTSG